ncbi:unnamed protein product [Cuscuta campestris]|uniref:Ubiquitin-like protease family profile domain-containing protein n=1 Tax=Cuscuta campestris TaxID=132261 RepID=A0A484L5Q9_9ASTE|nr:unnamed protein product [Cuscuta campestris]
MFYLEVKRFNYKLTQTYSTVTPFFLECLKRHQDDIDKKIKTKEDVGSVSNLTAEVFGFARKCAFPWARSDFVYMPLNTGGHWVLLVLAAESKIVWVYNSKGGRSLKDIAEYSTCIKCLLPKLMDLCDVYINHPTGPMGDNKLDLKAADFCPKQIDAGSCGMFVLKIAEYLMMDMDIRDIRTDQMAAYRMKMATELVRFAESNMAAKE